MKVSGMEPSSIPKGAEHVIDSPKLDATTMENRMAKAAILFILIVNNNSLNSRYSSHCSSRVTSLNEHRSATELLSGINPTLAGEEEGYSPLGKHSGGIMLLLLHDDTTRDKWV